MIYGERVRLRGIKREDIPPFLRWFNDPKVRQYLLMYAPMFKAQEEHWFESNLNRKDDFLFAIEVHVEDKWVHIGNVGLHRIGWKNRTAVLGIALDEKDYGGKDYGTDSVCTMLKFGLETLNLHRVELEVFAFNPRALRCYEKAEFKEEGTRRCVHFHEGQSHDVYYMGILQKEFLREKK